jgi:hypothetical protein
MQSIGDLAASLSTLAHRAVAEYAPLVQAIVRERSDDVRHIEQTLDGLLGFCFDPEALLLYRKLCRHYYAIDPAATALYIRAYREMWDSDPEAQPCEHATEARPAESLGTRPEGVNPNLAETIKRIADGLDAQIAGQASESGGGSLAAAAGSDAGLLGSMREDAELLDAIVEDAMRRRRLQSWCPRPDDFAALETMAEETGRSLNGNRPVP